LKIDDDVARLLLAHLDGTRDRAALAALLAREVEEGRLSFTWDSTSVEPNSPALPALLSQLVDHHLHKLVRLALLIG
jgi:hypothetical protein